MNVGNYECGLCGKNGKECEKDAFCQRTILSGKKHITINNEFGMEIRYFSFADVTDAMQEYSQGVLMKYNMNTRTILIEKIKTPL